MKGPLGVGVPVGVDCHPRKRSTTQALDHVLYLPYNQNCHVQFSGLLLRLEMLRTHFGGYGPLQRELIDNVGRYLPDDDLHRASQLSASHRSEHYPELMSRWNLPSSTLPPRHPFNYLKYSRLRDVLGASVNDVVQDIVENFPTAFAENKTGSIGVAEGWIAFLHKLLLSRRPAWTVENLIAVFQAFKGALPKGPEAGEALRTFDALTDGYLGLLIHMYDSGWMKVMSRLSLAMSEALADPGSQFAQAVVTSLRETHGTIGCAGTHTTARYSSFSIASKDRILWVLTASGPSRFASSGICCSFSARPEKLPVGETS